MYMKVLFESYLYRFNNVIKKGYLYKKEDVNYESLNNLIENKSIINYIVDDIGVKIFINKDIDVDEFVGISIKD